MEACLYNLSTELLIEIFKYLSLKDLLRLRLTCHRFNIVISSGMHLLITNDLLATNQLTEEMRARSKIQLSMFEKVRISKNWINGRYKLSHLYIRRKKCMPRLSLQKDCIWFSRERFINCYKRDDRPSHQSVCSLAAESDADVCSFVYKQNCLVSGLGDGSVWLWSPKFKKQVLHYKRCHSSDINAIDLEGAIFATGSRDYFCKIWSLNIDGLPSELRNIYSIRMMDRVWSAGFSPGGQYLLAGTAGRKSSAACLIDVERKGIIRHLDHYLPKGWGILDIKWESPDIVWTCGYDTCLRRWDLRTNQCVQHWEDPYLSAAYTFDYDNYCTAITGVQHHGRTVLWDTRQQIYVQMYFMRTNSPVYSLGFDATNLYAATDCNLNVLDFTDSKAAKTGYSNHFSKVIICR